jgi:iron complex outermembrane receptor protein
MRIVLGLIVLLSQATAYGQLVLIDTLRTFTVIENRSPEQNPGLNQIHISADDALNKPYSLGELLSRASPAFIKQYSPGTLASPSLRGSGSAHTALVWNGVNLHSSMNGQMDLSLVPSVLFDEFIVQEGAGAASWGSGAIGGTIFLNSHESQNTGLRISHNSGSWGFRQQSVDFGFKVKGVYSRTRVYHSDAVNNFRFIDVSHPDHPTEHQENAAQNAIGWMQDLKFKTSKNSVFNASVWGQKSLRHIPPILTVPHSVAHQSDKSLRATARWAYHWDKSSLKIRTAYLEESITYNDSFLDVHSQNKSKSYIGEITWSKEIGSRHNFELGHIYTLNRAKAFAFGEHQKEQNRPAFFTSLRSSWFENESTETLLSFRQEFFDGIAVNPLPSLSISHRLNKIFKLRAQASATFRIPTLNDLYWIPGGNPNLKPESGSAYEGGVDIHIIGSKNLDADLSIGFFSTRVENWILWVPTATFWSPLNVNTVQSRGGELNVRSIATISKELSLEFTSHWQVVNSTILKNEMHPQSVGKRLIYVPDVNSNSNLTMLYRTLSFSLIHSYSGLRFVTTDNSDFLPAFNLFHISMAKELSFSEHHAQAFFQWNNIANATYHVVVRRPMPLRSWMAGISFEFKT